MRCNSIPYCSQKDVPLLSPKMGGITRLEEVLGVEQAGVNLGGRLVAEADHKDLRRGVPRGGRLCGLHLVKELLERVQQRIVILGPAP